MEYTYEPVQDPPLIPLEIWWQEDDKDTIVRDDVKKWMTEQDNKKVHDASYSEEQYV